MKKAILFLFLCVPVMQVSGQYLVKKGKTAFTIVLPDSPSPVEQTAANELKKYLDENSGIHWTIASEKDVPENTPQILVGNSARAKKFFPEINSETIPYDGIEIHLKKDKLLLTGHEQRGALYAVNTFLEDVLNIRWWTSSEQFVPTHKTLKMKPLNISFAPKLIYRESFYKDAFDPTFATRMKCNGAHTKIPAEYGDHHSFVYFVHSFFPLLPPSKYFDDHPEWYSEIGGQRKYEHTQLCLTNDEMRKELTKNALEALRKNPDAKFISISQNDWHGYCTCEKCTAVAEEEGSQSGPLIRFVNAVAEDIEKEFPDVFVETLAYQYTRKPPLLVKPRDNVVIRLCTIECSFVQPLTGEQNKSLYDDIVGWNNISKQLFVWDYVTNFSSSILPHPNLRVLAPNIRFFVDNGTIGLFEQGDAYCTVGDFVRMRNWVISKLLWNPALDEKQLTREFINGYYGKKAAPLLLDYFETILNKAETSGAYIGCFRENTDDWLDYETLAKATTIFDKAIAVAAKESGQNSEYVTRLRRERLPLEHVWLKGYYRFKRYADKKGLDFAGPTSAEEACKSFFATCDQHQVTAYREFNTLKQFADFREDMLLKFVDTPTSSIPDEVKNLSSDTWIDLQEYDFNTVNVNGWSANVNDPEASNKRALRMPGNHNEWAVQVPFQYVSSLFDNVGADTKFKIIAYLRCDATVTDGLAMTCGVYDTKQAAGIIHQNINVSTISGAIYQKIALEPVSIAPSRYLWFAPPKREGDVQAVYIDRVIIIKE